MSDVISLNIVSRTAIGHTETFSSPVIRGIDTKDIISPIRENGLSQSYFFTKTKGIDTNDARNNAQINYISSDALSVIKAKSYDFVLLTVLYRGEVRKTNMNSEQMLFLKSKILEALEPDDNTKGTKFYYVEYGDPYPIQYGVSETIAQIVAQSSVGTIVDKEVPTGVIDGSNKVFTLVNAPTTGTEYVTLNGQIQTPPGDYSLVGNTITFVVAPPVSSQLWVTYRY